MTEKTGLIDASQKHWTDGTSEPEFYQLRLFGGVKIKKDPRENLKRLLKVGKPDNGLKNAGKEWPW